jgi:hypothetical protein
MVDEAFAVQKDKFPAMIKIQDMIFCSFFSPPTAFY